MFILLCDDNISSQCDINIYIFKKKKKEEKYLSSYQNNNKTILMYILIVCGCEKSNLRWLTIYLYRNEKEIRIKPKAKQSK